MAHLHEVRDMDTHFVIDPVTRAITNPNSQKNKLMQGDHNSEIYTFEIPKLVEGHDMSLCNQVRIHYNDIASDKANESKDVYTVDDLHLDAVETDNLTFSWLISGNATKYAGLLSFRIQFLCIDESGAITYKWHTEVFKGITVSDGFDNTPADLEEYSDILAAWEVRLDALEQGGSGIEVTAKPGQLIRVKETDENGNPTAWEAVPWGYTEGGMVEILPETDAFETTDPRVGEAWMVVGTPSLVIGETYTVIYNGVMYDCVSFDGGSFVEGAVALGNTAAMGGANTGEPFAVLVIPIYNAVICKDLTGATSVRIGIMGKSEIHHPIPGELLPEALQFGDKEVVLLPETELTFVENPDMGGMVMAMVILSATPIDGVVYHVTFAGVEYECSAIVLEEGTYYLGSTQMGGGVDDGVPFGVVVMESEGVGIVLSFAGETTANVSITGVHPVPMDVKYAPEPVFIDLKALGLGEVNNAAMVELFLSDADVKQSVEKQLRAALKQGIIKLKFDVMARNPNIFAPGDTSIGHSGTLATMPMLIHGEYEYCQMSGLYNGNLIHIEYHNGTFCAISRMLTLSTEV